MTGIELPWYDVFFQTALVIETATNAFASLVLAGLIGPDVADQNALVAIGDAVQSGESSIFVIVYIGLLHRLA